MAQAEFTSAEHVKRQGKPQRGGAFCPAPLWEAAAQPVQQGQRVGRGGRQAATGIKRSAATRGPIADGAALAPYKRFASGKTLAQAEFISAEHVKRQGKPQRGGAFCPAPLWEAAAQPVQQSQRVGRGGRQAAVGGIRAASARIPRENREGPRNQFEWVPGAFPILRRKNTQIGKQRAG